jgi:hypothetical protein
MHLTSYSWLPSCILGIDIVKLFRALEHRTKGDRRVPDNGRGRFPEQVIVNSEIWPDTMQYKGKTYQVNGERTLREFLSRGGRTGFVASTDTHDGKTAAKTAVLTTDLTRPAIFDAPRHRRNYAVFNARIVLDFQINNHVMGEEIEIDGKTQIVAEVRGTANIDEVVIVRDGVVIHSLNPGTQEVRVDFQDDSFPGNSYYYLRVIQADRDEHGNRSHAWSSPIWVKKK